LAFWAQVSSIVPPGVAGAVGLVADGLDGAVVAADVGGADVGGTLVAGATALDDAAEALALAALPAVGCAEPQAATRPAAATRTPTVKGRRVARPAPPSESCTGACYGSGAAGPRTYDASLPG
jgi:hypothetical protein